MPRPRVDLDAWKDQVKQWIDDGLNQDEMRRNLWKEGGIQISERTFGKRLREWGIWANQPYLSSNDMEALRKRITEIFNEGRLTDPEAVQALKNEGFNVRPKTYQYLRRRMGLYKRSQSGFRPLENQNTKNAEAG